MTSGVVYIAYGENARRETLASLEGLHQHYTGPTTVFSDRPLPGAVTETLPDDAADPGARKIKLQLDTHSPYDHTAYIDADTRIRQGIDAGFRMLADGWEFVLAPSGNQDEHFLDHIHPTEVQWTEDELGFPALNLQAGVMFFRKCEAVHTLFRLWREEWLRGGGLDQGALLRALQRAPVRAWLLGRPWNGGAIIEHRFGDARRDK